MVEESLLYRQGGCAANQVCDVKDFYKSSSISSRSNIMARRLNQRFVYNLNYSACSL
jgi:hypothetical protein